MMLLAPLPQSSRCRVIWKPWVGHNARVLAERERARNKWFGWSPRDPKLFVKVLPERPLFYSPAAAALAAELADGNSRLRMAQRGATQRRGGR